MIGAMTLERYRCLVSDSERKKDVWRCFQFNAGSILLRLAVFMYRHVRNKCGALALLWGLSYPAGGYLMSETRSELRGLGTGSTEFPVVTLRATICNHAWPTWSTDIR